MFAAWNISSQFRWKKGKNDVKNKAIKIKKAFLQKYVKLNYLTRFLIIKLNSNSLKHALLYVQKL